MTSFADVKYLHTGLKSVSGLIFIKNIKCVLCNIIFNAFGSISCMLIVKRIWTCFMKFVLYKIKLIIIFVEDFSCIFTQHKKMK